MRRSVQQSSAITRQSLTGLDWLTDDIGELRQAYETACRIIPQGAMWQAA